MGNLKDYKMSTLVNILIGVGIGAAGATAAFLIPKYLNDKKEEELRLANIPVPEPSV